MALPHMNNEELVSNMMNFSQYGALSPMFVMAALHHYTDFVIEHGPAQLEEEKESGKIGLINTEAWIGVAKEIKQKLEDNVKNF